MNSDKDHIKKRFASKLTGFAPEVPASVWDRIDADLTAKQGHQAPPRKKIWLRAATWVAAAAAIIWALLLFQPKDFNPEVVKPMAITEKEHNTQSGNNNNSQQQPTYGNKVDKPTAIYASAKKSHTIVDPNNLAMQAKQIRVIRNSKLPLIENVHKGLLTEKSRTKGIEIISEKFAEQELARKIAEMLAGSQNDVFFANNNMGRSSNGLEFGVNGNSGFTKANNTDQVKQGGGVVLRNSLVTMKHEQPITLGFNLNKKLTDRLSIESGVSYTYLSSKSKSDKVTVDILSKKQEFHYLGVPLSLNYSLANWKKFQAYASIGGVVQKDFYGRVIEKKYNSELLNWEESSKTNVSQMRPQLSVTSSLGLSYPIYNKLRAYTTVGGAYYFNSDNEHQTIYSEKKWMLNLNLGLKIEF